MTIFDWVDRLNEVDFASHKDWRLPMIRKLEGLVDFSAASPPVIDVAFRGLQCGEQCGDLADPECNCNGGAEVSYASYTSVTTSSQSPLSVWRVQFLDGFSGVGRKDEPTYVRAVRGASSAVASE